jgi:tubulin gamma
MSAMTSTLRFPGYFYNDLTSIVSALAPIKNCHYVIAGYTPFSADVVDSVIYEIITEALGKDNPQNKRF